MNGEWVKEETNASISGGLANSGQFQIGNTACTTPRINGMVDDVNILNRRITDEEVEEFFYDKGFCPDLTVELETLHPSGIPVGAKVTDLWSNFANEFELVAGAGDDEEDGKKTTSPDADTTILFTKPPGTSNLGELTL